jgi:O-antigen biosynthesis protein WbqP
MFFYVVQKLFRILDIIFSSVGLVLASPLLLTVYIALYCETRSPIFMQYRLGLNQKPFILYKFRTMKTDTPSIATHLVASSSVRPFGKILRRTKLDEIPQLFNVIKGDMSMVGPRPGLENHLDLTNARVKYGIFNVRPGITGRAQVLNIDMSTPELLAQTDAVMIENMSIYIYFKILILTLVGVKRCPRFGINV